MLIPVKADDTADADDDDDTVVDSDEDDDDNDDDDEPEEPLTYAAFIRTDVPRGPSSEYRIGYQTREGDIGILSVKFGDCIVN